MWINRSLEVTLSKAAEQFPVVFLTGPRQSGKTSLLKRQFSHYRYVNLEDPDIRQWAIEQPRDFLKQNPWPVILDEVQYAPGLFSYIQLIVDQEQSPGMFILTGSQNFMMMEPISQSLAGRTAILSFLPFSHAELGQYAERISTDDLILQGFYPRIYGGITEISLFYKSYINTYVERDVRQLANIGNSIDFIRFIRLCAGRTGQLLNMSSLATEAGIAHTTCKNWLSFLTTSYIVNLVQPFHKNFNKKIVKTPKIFFLDTGLLCSLLGIHSRDILAWHPLRGAIFENLIYTEFLKAMTHRGLDPGIWFWRDNHGTEVDFVLGEYAQVAVEVKSGQNYHDEYLRNLHLFSKYNPNLKERYLVYDGSIERKIGKVELVNWMNIQRLILPGS